MAQDDERYYRRRLREEEDAAKTATCPAARERHEELAGAYRVRLQFAQLRDVVPHALRKTFAESLHSSLIQSPRIALSSKMTLEAWTD